MVPFEVVDQLVGRVVAPLAERVDDVFVRFAFEGDRESRQRRTAADLVRLEEAAQVFAEADAAGRLFRAPAPADLSHRQVGPLPGGELVDVQWPSGYEPVSDAYDQLLAQCRLTEIAHARWFRHYEPLATLICLHGWGGGLFPFEERAYLARWLYSLGVDVVLMTLPFHARRGLPGRLRPLFPNTEAAPTNDGFAHAIHDLRALMLALRERGVASIGVSGMSLGGFTTALLGTVEPTVDALIPVIPFASYPSLLWEHGRRTQARTSAVEAGLTLERLEAAYAATTPLRRPPVIGPEKVLVISGERDRVTPKSHGQILREHFSTATGQARMETFAGAHLIQSGRGDVFRAIARFLGARGLLPPR